MPQQLWEVAADLPFPVFPCLANKKPACTHGFKDASRDRGQIKNLFQASPTATLIGIPTGAISGIDVLDVDTTRHTEAVEWLKKTALPLTRLQKTHSGGWHYFFRHASGCTNWTSYPVPGIDGRGDGGYVIAWEAAGLPSNKKEILEWPKELLASFQRPHPKRSSIGPAEPINDSKLAGVIRSVAHAANGERNDLLFWGACRVAEWIDAGELGRAAGERLLTIAALRAGLDNIEIARTIKSALEQRVRHADSTR